MGLIVGIGRWRQHHVVAEDEEGMTAAEMATVLRAALPLADLPDHACKSLKLSVFSEDESVRGDGELVRAAVEGGGSLRSCSSPADHADGWGRGKVGTWIQALLSGDSRKLLVGGDRQLVGDSLAGLHEKLWAPGLKGRPL